MLKDKEDELWDVYDRDRVRTGRLCRRGDKLSKGDYHMVVHVCIFNSRGELLIQKRQPFKKGWTNMWDITVGGSALAGDSSCEAAEREVYEELGLKIDLSHVRPVFTMNFDRGFDDYYIIEMDVDISTLKLQYEEVSQVRYVCKEEALRMQEEGIMIPYWFLDKLFDIRNNYDAHGELNRVIRTQPAQLKNLESCVSLSEIISYDTDTAYSGNGEIENFRKRMTAAIENHTAVVALHDNVVVGVLIFSENKKSTEYIAVHPEYSGQGIEKLLQEEAFG